MEKSRFESEFIGEYSPYREKIEWANYWWDEAFSPSTGRILLIGDSSSRFYRRTVADKLNCAVDFLGTSSTITDPIFQKELEMFFAVEEYHYDLIHMQIGVHGIVPEGEQNLLEDYPNYYEFYERDYRRLILYLMGKCNRLVLATITPVIVWKQIKNPFFSRVYARLHRKSLENIDERFDEGIRIRNEILKKIANEYNIPVNDLYSAMSTGEGKHLRHIDHIHYERAAKDFFAGRLIQYYRSNQE
ncbi:MAG TPA: SGNH/GDSL hydrolase family protein [Candidatus Mediterraneibacter faecavium]|uniref:SGNH/GDSL hydrolase family protein n=1 Tax=Candidatus Mediterraneibacter faecavium TaxID=2838668 RepID=A0A9D2QA98_9FIRM|nr:SGNH/GDSL hydrolase family protein [Candidatus Mediterraneibacter faecavium]